MSYSVKAIRQHFKNNGIFYTSSAMAEYLKSLLPPHPRDVYDPTCGRGALLSVFDEAIPKFGQDINQAEIEIAQQTLANFTGVVGDTLTNPAFADRKFHCITANPPFSIKWQPNPDDERFSVAPTVPTAGKADYAFLLHIISMLADDGVAAVINFPGVLYRGNREGVIRQWLVEQNFIDKVIHFAGNQFEDTSIATCCLVLKKVRSKTDIEFIDTENDLRRHVSLAEIKSNNFNLSVSQYLQLPEPESPPIDPIALELEAQNSIISRIKADLDFSFLIANIEQANTFIVLLDKLQDVINDYRRKVQLL